VDVLEFLAHSEWPLIGGAALFVIRQPLVRMLDRVNPTKVDAWGLKAEFEKTLDKVELLAPPVTVTVSHMAFLEDSAAPVAVPSTPTEPPPEAPFLVPASPETVILGAWGRLETLLREKMNGKQHLPRLGLHWTPTYMLVDAAPQFGLTPDETAALRELHKLRDQVAHSFSPSVTYADALRFRDAVDRLSARLMEGPKGEDGRAAQ